MTRESAERAITGIAMSVIAIALSSCAPQGGYQPVIQQASGSPVPSTSFSEADTTCWVVSMNIAGYAATIPQLDAYIACMGRNGWEDRRSIF